MKLLFLDSIERGVFGGIESWIGMVSRGLTRRGHTVLVAGRHGSEYLRRTALVCGDAQRVELKISGDFDPVTIVTIKKLLRRHEIDVVICNFNKDIRLGGLAARWHGPTKVVWRSGNNLTRDSFVHRYLTPRLLDGIITPSHDLKRKITQLDYLTEDMVEVIPTGIEDTDGAINREQARAELRRKYNLSEDCFIAVTSGRFVNQKGHVYLIEAARKIVKRYPDMHFLLLGDGPLEPMLKRKISEAGLSASFILAGLLDEFQLELAGSDIMLHPAIEEPFGIVLLEGMRAGLPIVASRVGGIPEVVDDGKTGLLVEPRQSEALTVAALSLLDDHTRLEAYGQAGCERWRNEFRYDVMLDRLETCLQRLVNGGGIRG